MKNRRYRNTLHQKYRRYRSDIWGNLAIKQRDNFITRLVYDYSILVHRNNPITNSLWLYDNKKTRPYNFAYLFLMVALFFFYTSNTYRKEYNVKKRKLYLVPSYFSVIRYKKYTEKEINESYYVNYNWTKFHKQVQHPSLIEMRRMISDLKKRLLLYRKSNQKPLAQSLRNIRNNLMLLNFELEEIRQQYPVSYHGSVTKNYFQVYLINKEIYENTIKNSHGFGYPFIKKYYHYMEHMLCNFKELSCYKKFYEYYLNDFDKRLNCTLQTILHDLRLPLSWMDEIYYYISNNEFNWLDFAENVFFTITDSITAVGFLAAFIRSLLLYPPANTSKFITYLGNFGDFSNFTTEYLASFLNRVVNKDHPYAINSPTKPNTEFCVEAPNFFIVFLSLFFIGDAGKKAFSRIFGHIVLNFIRRDLKHLFIMYSLTENTLLTLHKLIPLRLQDSYIDFVGSCFFERMPDHKY